MYHYTYEFLVFGGGGHDYLPLLFLLRVRTSPLPSLPLASKYYYYYYYYYHYYSISIFQCASKPLRF